MVLGGARGLRIFKVYDIIKNSMPKISRKGGNSLENNEKQYGSGIIAGRNPVAEALRAGRPIDCVYVAQGQRAGQIPGLLAKAKALGVPIKEADPRKLSHLCNGANHQGIVAVAAAKEFSTVEDMLALAQRRGEPPLLLICDGLEDPHNLGAVLRSAECAGAHGVIIPKRRSVGLTYAVDKASAGALEHMPVARVQNLAGLIDGLKEKGIWVFAADMDGTPWCQADLTGPAALVIGSEGRGVSRLVKEKCDFVLSLPVRGQVNSLNASVAAGILCYEAVRQRLGLAKAR